MTKLQHADGQAGGAEGARANPNPVTPAEAKAIWEILEEPVSRSVADWFTARGRPVSHETIWQWKRAGWPDSSAADIAKAAGAVRANTEMAAAALNGDAGANKAAVIEPNLNTKAVREMSAPPDQRSNADRAEEALLAALACATAVFESIRNIALGVPSVHAAGAADERPVLLLEEPDNIAEMMETASEAINTAVAGFGLLAALRAEQSVSAPGMTGLGSSRH
ncbi:MAG: hypothetical protein V7608_828 [Hyphomicrobiales bacterium]|jgi:hypothetical protein